MGTKAYLRDDSPNALAMRVVVTAAGAAIAKRYEPTGLHEGDVGIQMRFDRGKLTEGGMTAEQRTTAQALARDMTAELHAALGIAEPGFKPGMVVEVVPDEGNNYYGCVVRETESGLILQTVNREGRVRATFAPFQFTMHEMLDRCGLNGTVWVMLENNLLDHWFSPEGAGAVVELVTDEAVLTMIAQHNTSASHDEARQKAAAKIQSEEQLIEVLVQVAVHTMYYGRLPIEMVGEIAERIQNPDHLESTVIRIADETRTFERRENARAVCFELLGRLDASRLRALYERTTDRSLQDWIITTTTEVDLVFSDLHRRNQLYSHELYGLRREMIEACLARLPEQHEVCQGLRDRLGARD